MADQRHRRIPRDDRAHDADRLAYEQTELAAQGRLSLLLEREGFGQRGIRVERARADHPGVLRESEERAGLARPQLAEHVIALFEAGAQRADVLGPLGVGEPRPGALVERLARRGHGPGHVVGRRLCNAVVDVLGGGVDDVDGRVGRRCNPRAPDEEPIGVQGRCGRGLRRAHLTLDSHLDWPHFGLLSVNRRSYSRRCVPERQVLDAAVHDCAQPLQRARHLEAIPIGSSRWRKIFSSSIRATCYFDPDGLRPKSPRSMMCAAASTSAAGRFRAPKTPSSPTITTASVSMSPNPRGCK